MLSDAEEFIREEYGIDAELSADIAAFATARESLRNVDNGRQRLLPALSGYEREMIRYGFAAVRASLTQMHRLHADSPISRLATKVFFRPADLSPALQKRMLDLGD
jgi:hypothetical protein